MRCQCFLRSQIRQSAPSRCRKRSRFLEKRVQALKKDPQVFYGKPGYSPPQIGQDFQQWKLAGDDQKQDKQDDDDRPATRAGLFLRSWIHILPYEWQRKLYPALARLADELPRTRTQTGWGGSCRKSTFRRLLCLQNVNLSIKWPALEP